MSHALRAGPGGGRCLGLLAALLALGCAPAAWEPSQLEQRVPALRDAGPHRLADVTPYMLPVRGTLVLFLCRWTTDAPIPVALPIDAGPAERRALEAALRAWEGAALGIRFVRLEGGSAPLEVLLEDGPVTTAGGEGTGNAVVDCRVDPGDAPARAGETLPAELVSATVTLARRTPPDARGRDRALTEEELAGAALHELGHALGFQGHVRSPVSALARDVEALRRLGAWILAGAAFYDPTLGALYRAPSGTVLSRVPVEPWRTDLVDRMARLALASGLEGPFVRVGDRAARVFWRDGGGREYGLQLLDIGKLRRRPERLVIVPEPRTRSALPRSRDLRP